MHSPQSAEALTPTGQAWHCGPNHDARHVQLQPVRDVPVTEAAWPLQLLTLVHVNEQLGKPLYVLRHPSQKVVFMPGGHRSHVVPNQKLLHVQLQRVLTVPTTTEAWLLQLPATVQSASQFGYPENPAAQSPQSFALSKPTGQTLHAAPRHRFLHVQLHPFRQLPETRLALPLQLPRIVQRGEQYVGYPRGSKPVLQLPHRLLALKPTGHVLHRASFHSLSQMHVQPVVKRPVTAAVLVALHTDERFEAHRFDLQLGHVPT
jgi:hypothetical protein